jgi:alkylhydroperoxidase/carboxymuconolactone decarboxylase family protein YurZ
MDYTERLRRLAINDPTFVAGGSGDRSAKPQTVDSKTLALVRIGAIIAIGASVPSFGEAVDAAIAAGATTDEVVDLLFGLVPVIGLPRVVAAAPQLGLALGYDVESAL